MPPSAPDDYAVARRQFIKSKRAETRLKFALMADAAVARGVPQWEKEFDAQFRAKMPQVLDLASELKRLTDGGPA